VLAPGTMARDESPELCTVVGLNVAVAPGGTPAMLRFTNPVNPPDALTVTP
jgi:hypothetical protein